MNSEMQIVRVTLQDLGELQNLARQTFIESFAGENTPENMQHYLEKSFSAEQLKKEIANAFSEWYFVLFKNKKVGYLKINFSEAQTDVRDEKSLEIERIYVVRELQRQKIGQLLFQKALEIATEKKFKYIWLGVWEKNLKAIKFYERNGFAAFDTHVFTLGTEVQIDILMKLQLKENNQ
jgi:diamine N-acetyltransferase